MNVFKRDRLSWESSKQPRSWHCSYRLIVAMVALVLFTVCVTGLLIFPNVVATALPRALERFDLHVRVLATEFEAIVRSARADVLAFGSDAAVDELGR